MKWFRGFCLVIILSIFGVANVYAGEDYCAGYHSPGNSYAYCNSNPKGKGNCVWWSAYKRPELNFSDRAYGKRHGKTWIAYAKRFGYVINYDYPVVGAIAVFDQLGIYGHVAHVDKIYMGPFLPGKAPFDVSEMGYDWFNSVATSTYRAVSKRQYQRYNATKAGGFKSPTHLAGFIYPTRTVKYGDDYRLVLMRKDGAIPQSCNQVDQATMYMLDESKNLHVIKLGNKNWAQLVCYESNSGGPLQDVDDIAVYLSRRRGAAEISDGIGGGSYTPPTGNYTGGGGATEHSQPGESDHAGYKHNVSMDDTELARAGTDSYDRKWTFYHGEVPVVNVRTKLHNKTNHEIGKNDVTIKWYESPNKTFNPNHDHHFATDHNKHSIEAFEHNSHSDELVERKNLTVKI